MPVLDKNRFKKVYPFLRKEVNPRDVSDLTVVNTPTSLSDWVKIPYGSLTADAGAYSTFNYTQGTNFQHKIEIDDSATMKNGFNTFDLAKVAQVYYDTSVNLLSYAGSYDNLVVNARLVTSSSDNSNFFPSFSETNKNFGFGIFVANEAVGTATTGTAGGIIINLNSAGDLDCANLFRLGTDTVVGINGNIATFDGSSDTLQGILIGSQVRSGYDSSEIFGIMGSGYLSTFFYDNSASKTINSLGVPTGNRNTNTVTSAGYNNFHVGAMFGYHNVVTPDATTEFFEFDIYYQISTLDISSLWE